MKIKFLALTGADSDKSQCPDGLKGDGKIHAWFKWFKKGKIGPDFSPNLPLTRDHKLRKEKKWTKLAFPKQLHTWFWTPSNTFLDQNIRLYVIGLSKRDSRCLWGWEVLPVLESVTQCLHECKLHYVLRRWRKWLFYDFTFVVWYTQYDVLCQRWFVREI